MITVTFTSKGDLIVIPKSFSGIFGVEGFPGLLVPRNLRPRYRTGLKPLNGTADEFGEKPCSHTNVKGHIMSLGLDSQFIEGVQSYSYLSDASSKASVTNVVRCMKVRNDTNRWFSHLVDVNDEAPFKLVEPWKFNVISTYPVTVYDKSQRTVELRQITPTKFTTIIHTVRKSLTTNLTTYELYQYKCHEFKNDTYLQYRSGGDASYVNNPSAYYALYWVDMSSIAWSSVTSNYRLQLAVDSPDLDSQFSKKLLFERAQWVRSLLRIPNPIGFGELANVAAGNTKYLEINTSKYFMDLFTISQIMAPYSGLPMFAETTLVKAAKLLLSFSLTMDYGVRLTLIDTQRLIEASSGAEQFQKMLVVCYVWNIARGRAVENATMIFAGRNYAVDATKTLKFRYKPSDNASVRFLQDVMAWDLFPTLGVAWDFIPFSYLVSGLLTPLREWMDRVDSNTYKALLTVGDCVYSSRYEVSGMDPYTLFGSYGRYLWGSVDIVFYERSVVATLPYSDISRLPGTEFNLNGLWRFVRDGVTVFLQRNG